MRIINLIGQMPDGGSRRSQSQITKIAIHYSGTKTGSAKAFADHHTNKLGWRTSGYHEIVALNGDLELCYNPTTITNGVGGNNSYTYHISYVGDGQPTSAQLNTLTERTLYNLKRFNLKYTDILGHREFPNQSTACPALNMRDFRIRIKDKLNSPNSPNNSNILKLGDRGEGVRVLQSSLALLGYSVGAIDGIFGEATKQVVKSFQRANGLTVDGIAGRSTLDRISELIKGDDDKLKLSGYQWGVLEKNVESLLKEKVITDQSWLTKTKNKSLTVSELAWLNNVVLQRLR